MKRLEGWTYLCGVSQEPEADIIVGLLNDNEIAARKVYPDAGEFMKIAYGLTSGVDIFVHEQEIKRARKLFEDFQGSDIYKEDDEGLGLQTGERKGREFERSEENSELEHSTEDPESEQRIENHESAHSEENPSRTAGKNTRWSTIIIILIALLGLVLLLQHKPIF